MHIKGLDSWLEGREVKYYFASCSECDWYDDDNWERNKDDVKNYDECPHCSGHVFIDSDYVRE